MDQDGKVSKLKEDTPHHSRQMRRTTILRRIRGSLPDFEECAACIYIMRRIGNLGQRR